MVRSSLLLPPLKDDIALSRLILRCDVGRGRRGRRPLHEAGQRPDVGLGHLQRLVLGQFVVWKVYIGEEMHRHVHVQCFGRRRRVASLNKQLSLICRGKRKLGGLFVASSHEKG